MELTKAQRTSALYIDVNADYTVGGKKILLTNVEAVEGKIYNVLTTPKRTLVMEPEFGCDLENYLKRPFTKATAREIEATVLSSLTQWVPEIVVGPSDISCILDAASPKFYLTVTYRIRQYGVAAKTTLTFSQS